MAEPLTVSSVSPSALPRDLLVVKLGGGSGNRSGTPGSTTPRRSTWSSKTSGAR